MKLIICPICKDIFKVTKIERNCGCKKTKALLSGNEVITSKGVGILIIEDHLLFEAMEKLPYVTDFLHMNIRIGKS